MEWGQVWAIVFSLGYIIGICTFCITSQLREISRTIKDEQRDFHRKLYDLQERYLQFRERK